MPQKDIAAMERAISRIEQAISERYTQLGKELLDLAETNQQVIDQLLDELIHLRKELADNQGERSCQRCSAFNRSDSRFCTRCGYELEGGVYETTH